jgi:S-(hydroxymethyl)glutathione dehydrogenase/alcohol dehydrogenase
MNRKFRAAVLEELGKPLVLRNLELPHNLYTGQVTVEIVYSGICGKQLVEQSGMLGPDRFLPHNIGHEASGIVRECGPGVRTVNLGDHVVLHWRKGDGIDALPPKYWCEELGKDVGAGQVATFNEMAVVSENRLTKLDKDIPFEVGALLGCAVTTGLGLVINEAKIKPGQSVVVVGCGGVGLNVIQGCTLVNAYPIVAVDILPEKIWRAGQFGASHGVNTAASEQDMKTWVLKEIGHPDFIIDTTGRQDVIEACWDMIGPSGKIFVVAQSTKGTAVSLDVAGMHQGKRIVASDGGATDPAMDIPRYSKLYLAGKLPLENLITHRWMLDQINTGLDIVRSGVVGRGLIRMRL